MAVLRASLREAGDDLVVRHGDPATELPALGDDVDADAVYTQTMPSTEEFETERAVDAHLTDTVAIERFWTHTLYHLDDLPTPVDAIEDTFTPWRKAVEREATTRATAAYSR